MSELFYILLWVCSALLVISGIDDVLVDLLYWFNRRKYKRALPDLVEINMANVHSIARVICAWRE
jgi:hypothetical protein